MFERFTDRARRVLVLAQEEARLLNHNFLGTEHILLGLIQEGEGVAAKALESLGISLEAVREKVEVVEVFADATPDVPLADVALAVSVAALTMGVAGCASVPEGSVDAAAVEFARSGYSGTTLADVAGRAGLQTGSLYYHFDSKESMVEELIEHYWSTLLANYREVVEAYLAGLDVTTAVAVDGQDTLDALLLHALDMRTAVSS